MDALQTKIAVNVQNLGAGRYQDQLRDNIAELPDATGCDAAFLALFHDDGSASSPFCHRAPYSPLCNPEPLAGEGQEAWPWLWERLGHLRLIDISDTDEGPATAIPELKRLAELNIGSCSSSASVSAANWRVSRASPTSAGRAWDANLHLLIKLFGASSRPASSGSALAAPGRSQERNELVIDTANDGIWDFDGQTKRLDLSPRWKAMLGYDRGRGTCSTGSAGASGRHGARAGPHARTPRRQGAAVRKRAPHEASKRRMALDVSRAKAVQDAERAVAAGCSASKSTSPNARSTRKRCSARRRARRSRCSRSATA